MLDDLLEIISKYCDLSDLIRIMNIRRVFLKEIIKRCDRFDKVIIHLMHSPEYGLFFSPGYQDSDKYGTIMYSKNKPEHRLCMPSLDHLLFCKNIDHIVISYSCIIDYKNVIKNYLPDNATKLELYPNDFLKLYVDESDFDVNYLREIKNVDTLIIQYRCFVKHKKGIIDKEAICIAKNTTNTQLKYIIYNTYETSLIYTIKSRTKQKPKYFNGYKDAKYMYIDEYFKISDHYY